MNCKYRTKETSQRPSN